MSIEKTWEKKLLMCRYFLKVLVKPDCNKKTVTEIGEILRQAE